VRIRIATRSAVAFALTLLLIACNRGGLSAEQRKLAEDALKALRKVEAATQVGVSYQQYGQLVIDAKAQVNEASAKLPDGELKKELEAAMESYADAQDGWSKCVTKPMLFLTDVETGDETGKRLKQKYNIESLSLIPGKPITGFAESVEKGAMLRTIWAAASQHVERASKLLSE
jgi:hypothetical protein